MSVLMVSIFKSCNSFANLGVESPVTKNAERDSTSIYNANLWAELIISRYKATMNTGFSLTKLEIQFPNGTLRYKKRVSFLKCNFLFYKRESRATIYSYSFTP